jgi:TPR repeat protein
MKRRYCLSIGLLTFVGVFCLTKPLQAGPLEDGGAAYERGNYATALRLFKPLAEQGDAAAQFFLGSMYAQGKGVPQDYVLPHMWVNLAAARYSDPSEKEKREITAKVRDRPATMMTAEQIAEAQVLATNWKPKGE